MYVCVCLVHKQKCSSVKYNGELNQMLFWKLLGNYVNFFVVFLYRGCTDIICCIIFVLAILGYVAVGILGESLPYFKASGFKRPTFVFMVFVFVSSPVRRQREGEMRHRLI